MRNQLTKMKRKIWLLVFLQAAVLIGLYMFVVQNVLSLVAAAAVLTAEIIAVIYVFDHFEDMYEEQTFGVKNVLGSSAEEAYVTGGIGLVIYDDSYTITWMSELFKQRGIERVNERITSWLPETGELISGDRDSTVVTLDTRVYEIHKKSDAPIMFFKDITDLSAYRTRYTEEKIVVGMASFDNYEESVQYADEAETANINAAVRTPVTTYCQEHGILVKRLNTYRYFMVLNEKIFNELVNDRFSVLAKVRKAAQKMDVSITLSVAFARGTSDFSQLDKMCSNLIDLAQTRGGDQAAIQVYGEEVKYFGGSTEALEKRSRVRVRVISHSLRELIFNSGNVIICGHKNADFDCIGSALCIARMVQALKKQVCIITKTGGIEEKLNAALNANRKELAEEVKFVSEAEALAMLRPSTLVIMTDHHNVKQSNGAKVIEAAGKVAIIDHHRRSTEIGVNPVLVYIEAGASSACELVTEMLPYISSRVDISELDATIMLAGMTIDTDHWHVRTGVRTYEAASTLRRLGGDPQKVNEMLKDTYDEFNLKSKMVACAQRYDKGVVIAMYNEKAVTRSLMSQVADSLLAIQGVEAAMVIANNDNGETCISARSAGRINVQKIMEKMKGGGHMTAAAMQRAKTTPENIKSELLNAIAQYWKEEESDDESNS